MPSPGRLLSYQTAAFSSSAEASSSVRKGRFTGRLTVGRRARAHPPTVRRLTHRPSHVERVFRSRVPTPFRLPPRRSSRARQGWPGARRRRSHVRRRAELALHEAVLARGLSRPHSTPASCGPTPRAGARAWHWRLPETDNPVVSVSEAKPRQYPETDTRTELWRPLRRRRVVQSESPASNLGPVITTDRDELSGPALEPSRGRRALPSTLARQDSGGL